MTNRDFTTVKEIAVLTKVTETTVYRWIKCGKITPTRQGKSIRVPYSQSNTQFLSSQLVKNRYKPKSAWTPKGIEGYNEWHELVDELCWLVKICYSSVADIKHKHFRLDQLFTNYLVTHAISLSKTAQVFASNSMTNPRIVTDDLKRGWYNELAYIVPIRRSTLGLSFTDIEVNKQDSGIRFAFPSWRITMAYYSIYFYLRGTTLEKQGGFRLQEHGATIQSFKNNLLQPLSRTLWKFPFDIAYTTHVSVGKTELTLTKLRYLRFKYTYHPREPHRSPMEIADRIRRVFAKRSKRKGNVSIYNLFDYLHDFRIWANYLDIDNLLSLWGSGYKSFIDQNLSLLVFFIGGIAEICYLAVFGERQYLKQMQKLYDLFATNNPELESDFPNTPVYQRLMIYNALGLVKGHISLKQKDSINKIVSTPSIK